jgi:hypothetical protein
LPLFDNKKNNNSNYSTNVSNNICCPRWQKLFFYCRAKKEKQEKIFTLVFALVLLVALAYYHITSCFLHDEKVSQKEKRAVR